MRAASTVCAAFLVAITAAAPPAPAQVAWPEFTVATGSQVFPGQAAAWAGGFVVTWNRNQSAGSAWDVYGRRMSPGGAWLGLEFRVNTHTTSDQFSTDVAVDDRGRFVVVWNHGNDVWARAFDGAGTAVGDPFPVNTYAGHVQRDGAAAAIPGGFVVVWSSRFQDGSGYGVFGQRLEASGAPRGAEFQVNVQSAGDQRDPAVSAAADGSFAVVWTAADGDGLGVVAARFDAAGARIGGEFQVNPATTGAQALGAVVSAPDGRFVVVWTNHLSSSSSLAARRFDAAGAPLSAALILDEVSPPIFFGAATACGDATGNFVVADGGYDSMTHQRGVSVRRFDAAANPLGAGTGVSFFHDNSFSYDVGCDPVGNALVTWDRNIGQVMGKRFGGLTPAALVVDPAGNGILEPGETVDARPSWSNVNPGALTFGGGAVLRGPAGPGVAYELPDAAAAYGTVPAASTGACVDCYRLGVTSTGPRPATHWDAVLDERITPAGLGQQQPWRVHLGDSFADLPRANPFYAFVETMLHNGVTAGCTATEYCPLAATSRAQMAVFALLAKEGPGYVPRPCATPVFDDVPAESPFCPWIEELWRRAVVAGCGGASYCPAASVQRDHMAVFMLATFDPLFAPPPCGATPRFADVPVSSLFCPYVEELARRGVVGGCGGGLYCPAAAVTRQEMGVFLTGTFGLRLYGS
jgi:hypothetical protein